MVQHHVKWYVLAASTLVIIAGILEVVCADDGEGGIHSGSGKRIPNKGKFGDKSHDDPPKRHRLNPNYDPSGHKRIGSDMGLGYEPTTRPPTTTTQPDWDYICYVLCGVGDGGLACDCDILPIG